MFYLFLLFVCLPILEIMLIIEVADNIGGWNTFAVVVITAFLGAFFVKREGIATLNSMQQKANQGEMPGSELVEGICLLIAGVLLVTPGFVTDIFGFLLTLPFTRKPIANYLISHLQQRQASGQNAFYFQFQQSRHRSGYAPHESTDRSTHSGDVYEGEVVSKDENSDREKLN